jgi:histidinol phosphatase-like PHP family hydrolase
MIPRADLHTHSIYSDGELIPAELVRRAMVLDHDVIAITDHVDMSNVEWVVSNIVKAVELCEDYIKVIPGVEITHVPPSKIDKVAKLARKYGAQWIVVHGETVTEPVMPGTNRASVENPEIDILAHPGFITLEEAQLAKDNDVILEITGRAGHNITNGHVANMARQAGAKMVIDSDTHAPENLMDEKAALTVALGAGLTKAEAEKALHVTPYEATRKL